MKFVRSLLAIVIGWIASMVIITGIEYFNFVHYLPPGDASPMEAIKKLMDDPPSMKEWIESMPPDAAYVVLAGWQAGAFFGGLICALIAGRARADHAAAIGVAVLAGTILNVLELKSKYEYSHPNWLLLAGLLLPIPISLLAGKLVAMNLPPAPVKPS